MAWKYLTGVVEPVGDHFVVGPSDATHTNIADLKVGAVRRIWRANQAPQVKAWAQRVINAGMVPIPTIFDHQSFGTGGVTPFDWDVQCNAYANALFGLASMVEVGNEPKEAEGAWAIDGTGPYFARFREAATIFHAKGIDVVLAGNPTGTAPRFINAIQAAGDIFALAQGIGLHPYYSIPGTSLSTGQLSWIKARRDQLDALGGAASGLPLWLTELGWCTQDHVGQPINLLVSEATQDAYLNQAYTNFQTYASTLRIKAACWFAYTDYGTQQNPDGFNFAGIRTDVSNPYNPGPWRYKNGGGQTGAVGIKATLDSFGKGVDLADPPPDAVTITPPLNITKTTARLRGTANPNGTPTTIAFDYGLTNTYGTTTTPVSVGNGNAAVAGFADVAGLTPDTTYHYRTRATSSAPGSPDFGSDATFKTLVAPQAPTVTTGKATDVKPTGATLTGVIDPNDLSTTWHFEYGPTTSYGTSAPVPDKDL